MNIKRELLKIKLSIYFIQLHNEISERFRMQMQYRILNDSVNKVYNLLNLSKVGERNEKVLDM